jgi:hypothetical protein
VIVDEDPIRTARRNTRRQEQGRCLFCWDCGARIENEHVAGRNHDPYLTAPICDSCHDALTENRRRAGALMERQPNSKKQVKYALKAAAVFLHELADAMSRWADPL